MSAGTPRTGAGVRFRSPRRSSRSSCISPATRGESFGAPSCCSTCGTIHEILIRTSSMCTQVVCVASSTQTTRTCHCSRRFAASGSCSRRRPCSRPHPNSGGSKSASRRAAGASDRSFAHVLRWPATLRWRLTLWYTALLAVPLIVLAIGFYALFARTLANRTDRFIDDALTAFSRELAAERRATLSADRAIHSTVEEVRFRDLHIAVLDGAGHLIAMTPIPAAEDRGEPTQQAAFDRWIGHSIPRGARPQTTAFDVDGRSGRFRVGIMPVALAGDMFELTGAYSTADIEAILARIRGVLGVVFPLLLLCAAGGGYFMASRSLAPVAAMASRAADITATNLRERLPVSGGQELAGLAHVVNELLARLDDSFSRQRRFMADASHELRTPTAILRTEADVTLAQAHRPEDEYRASLTVIRDAARRLTRIVEDLFALARVDAENVSARRERLYLEEIVDDSIRLARPLADTHGVQVSVVDAAETT